MNPAVPEAIFVQRPSTSLDRPVRAPFGPRRPKNSIDMTSPAGSSVDSTSPLLSAVTCPTFTNPFTSPDSPTHSRSQSAPQTTVTAPAHIGAEPAFQAPPTPLPPFSPYPTPLPPPAVSPKSPLVPTFLPPTPLPPPPVITFDPTPIQWKGLPLEAAHWTFSSADLQQIVSKAIRLSAKDSFVRLLSLQALEVDIVQESERLDAERLSAQAKWKFEVCRRTMLIQALNSTAAMFSDSGQGDMGNLLAGLISQLATSIASCDSQMSCLLRNSDQQSQITAIQHRHWASALIIGLRKVNKAYERQTEELKRVQTRIQTLEDELEDAWREAENMAVEFDVMEQEGEESEEEDRLDEDDEAEDINQDSDDTETVGDITINGDLGEVLGVTATAVASKATLVISPVSPQFNPKQDKSDAKSVKSTRSKRSTRDGPSHFSRISAARVRSRATSNASLRLPRALRTPSSSHPSPVDTPPIPAIPENLQGQSFLDMDMGNSVNEIIKRPMRFLPRRHPEPKAALPQPPHTAGLPRTNIPSIWLDGDGGPETRLNGLDRSHSLQIFPSLNTRTPQKGRRSNLVMSLSNSDLGSSMNSPVSAEADRLARLPHHEEVPRYRSLVGRASSVLLRRWSQATSSRKHYSSSLPTYRSKEESDTPPRIPTPNTG
ncbi:hypothetical protein PAXRUDRAFT_823095 [Paxillus rubicundulus Ve08.2h10]|uniref:Uncharacterized protein n=1 Tax=Paxillus rubicundulus Ve08.2h10 TaxID=930991 RepID=A0A0D0E469_9AGAM|nr:hypothetical protein PAXRUDRAFT_823095 [Paxillus rubicundulus Ve08.2h10]